MPAGRVVLIALGLLFAAGGVFLVVRAFRSADSAKTIPASPPAPDARGDRGKAADKGPRWQSFVQPGGREAPPRPVVRFARGVVNPFDRLATGTAVSRPGISKPGNPGLRLEGLSVGAQPVALISGRAVREGGTISGFRVLRISRSRVMLAGPRGASLSLHLGDGR